MGIAAAQANDFESAAVFIANAIQIAGPVAIWCANLGQILGRLGRHVDSAACFRQALAQDPLNSQLGFELGNALIASGNPPAAVAAFELAAELEPSNARFWYALAFALYRSGAAERAAECYERVLKIDPRHAETHFNLGVIRMAQSRIPEARCCFERTLELNPDHPDALNNLGLLQHDQGENQAATSSFRRACRARTGYYAAQFNLARVLADEQDVEGALANYQIAVERRPEHVDARLGLAAALVTAGRTGEAVRHLEAALECEPQSVAVNLNLAVALLQLGRWEEGWRRYESRFRRSAEAERRFDQPTWEGEPLAGRRILIYAEQGYGDTIQFSRYVPLVHELGARVVIECQPALVDVLASLDGVEQVVASGERLPAFDTHSALLSLPRLFDTRPDTVPMDVPYLLPDRKRTDEWSETLRSAVDPGLTRVGLTWAGNPDHKNDRHRSLDPGLLTPLGEVGGVAFFNLQRNARGVPGLDVAEMSEHCDDFHDTAAAILNLDLVISVDTSIAHLAGALGKPVWTMLPFAADWRWMLDRSDTPWYPTMRLFRQPKRGDWSSVIGSVRDELRKFSG